MDSVQAHALEWDEPAGALGVVPVDESKIDEDDRIPRVTTANWKYQTGAVGSLTHALVLQGYKYSCVILIRSSFLFSFLPLFPTLAEWSRARRCRECKTDSSSGLAAQD